MHQNLYGYNSMVPLKVAPGGLGPGGLAPHKIDCEKTVDSQNPQCQQHFENCCDKNCKDKPDCKSDCMEKGQTHCTQGPALPKGCDCTGTELGCCPRKNATNTCGDCKIKGCQKENGMCVPGDPEPSPVQSGCFRKELDPDHHMSCVEIGTGSCDKTYNKLDIRGKNKFKQECDDNNCFNTSDCSGKSWSLHSGPQTNPCQPIPSGWNKNIYDCILKNVPPEEISVTKCMIYHAMKNKINPKKFLNMSNDDLDKIQKLCETSNNKYEPPNFGSPSPSNFFDTTMGKVVIVSIIILVILGLIGLTIFITEKKGKKK